MNTTTLRKTELIAQLDAAHAQLVAARKSAALLHHESYEAIGLAIERVENAIEAVLGPPFDT